MHVIGEKSVELAFYLLKDIAYDWVTIGKKSRGKNAASTSWDTF